MTLKAFCDKPSRCWSKFWSFRSRSWFGSISWSNLNHTCRSNFWSRTMCESCCWFNGDKFGGEI